MRGRLRMRIELKATWLCAVEASLIGLFFIQAVRFLMGTLYAHVASASLYPAVNSALVDTTLPGLMAPATVSKEISFTAYMVALSLVTLLVGRFHRLIIVAALMTVAGRYSLATDGDISPVIAAAITMGGGLLYVAFLTRHRARILPYMFILALGLDQLLRAAGDTLDPSLPFTDTADLSVSLEYHAIQSILLVSAVVLAVVNVFFWERSRPRHGEDRTVSPDVGLMPFWGGIGFGALLFIQLSLLALPNAIGRRADTDYTFVVPLVMTATSLPLVPWVQDRARWYVGLFDRSVRGWSWMAVTMLMVVFGLRLNGIPAGVALILAQFLISLTWWWLVRPQAPKERNFTGLWIVLGTWVFALLAVADIFTYEYAFVRDFSEDYDFLNPLVPPLLRGFRGLGIAVLLLAVMFAVMPMVQTRQRIAWPRKRSGQAGTSFLRVVIVLGASVFARYLALPPIVQGVSNPENIRIGTYNIHAGFNEFYDYELRAQAISIQNSGANIMLLQEIEAGRMTSFGVDQPLWLARRLGMDVRFYPTNEGLQGLAVLSNIEIVYDDGVLLDSTGLQTGLQRVQVRPDPDAAVITVYNTWLDPLLDTGSGDSDALERDQQNQLSQIFGIISAHHQKTGGRLGRTVIGGTFNNIPDSDLIQRMLENDFIDYFADSPLELSATFRRSDAMARLDYLWTTTIGSFQVLYATVVDPVSSGIIDSHPSDHRIALILVQLR